MDFVKLYFECVLFNSAPNAQFENLDVYFPLILMFTQQTFFVHQHAHNATPSKSVLHFHRVRRNVGFSEYKYL